MKLNELQIGAEIYISKHVSGYQHMLKCEYLGLKKGRILGKIISISPEWATGYYFNVSEITCNKNKCSIYKEDKELSKRHSFIYKRHYWLNPKTLEFK